MKRIISAIVLSTMSLSALASSPCLDGYDKKLNEYTIEKAKVDGINGEKDGSVLLGLSVLGASLAGAWAYDKMNPGNSAEKETLGKVLIGVDLAAVASIMMSSTSRKYNKNDYIYSNNVTRYLYDKAVAGHLEENRKAIRNQLNITSLKSTKDTYLDNAKLVDIVTDEAIKAIVEGMDSGLFCTANNEPMPDYKNLNIIKDATSKAYFINR